VKLSTIALVFFAAMPVFAKAESLSCVSTTFNLASPNDKVCVTHFEDPNVSGVTCYISQARKGGWGQRLGLNEDPSHFAVSCRQTGPISVDISKLVENEEVCIACLMSGNSPRFSGARRRKTAIGEFSAIFVASFCRRSQFKKPAPTKVCN
jgi:catabolite regulation protein CreA